MTVSNTSAATGVSAADYQAQFKQTRADFQAIAAALQSGDLTQAQQAFAQLQKDNPRLAQALTAASSASDSPRLADLKSLAAALKSGDVSGAKQAFAQLQRDTQAVAGKHHHHQAAAAAAPASGTDSDGDNDNSTGSGSVLNASA